MQRLNHKIVGSGPTLLLIHGMGSASSAWNLITPELSKKFTVVTIDLPGHGDTPYLENQPMDPHSLALAVLNEMTELGFEKFDLCGNSLGGWVCLEMACVAPDRIKSITALAPAGLWLNPYNVRYPATALARFLAKYTAKLAPTALHFEMARALGFADVSPRWRNFSYQLCLDATIAMAKADGYYPAWDGMLMKRFDGKIPENILVTIIFGDTDRTLPETTCQERSVAPKHAKWIVFPNTGHAPMWDSPTDVIAAILDTTGAKS
jgi:pimeloyl-ACP methyl ester carboxylesterase